jgi:hypothetical protein
MSPDRGRGRAAPRESPWDAIPEHAEREGERRRYERWDGDDEAASESYEQARDAAFYDDAWRYE